MGGYVGWVIVGFKVYFSLEGNRWGYLGLSLSWYLLFGFLFFRGSFFVGCFRFVVCFLEGRFFVFCITFISGFSLGCM